MTNAISRALLGKIADEVFGGAIEDASVIEEIFAVIKREEAALSAAEPVKPYGYVYESTVRYCDGRGPHRKVDFFYTKKNISDDDIEEFEISETAVFDRPQQPAPSVAVKALDDHTMQKLREALRFSASRSVMSAADETRILSALSTQVQDVAIPEGWQLVPIKPPKDMAYAAACAHYGKKLVDQTGIEGISMTVNGIDYNFSAAFRRFWKGALAAAPEKQEGGK